MKVLLFVVCMMCWLPPTFAQNGSGHGGGGDTLRQVQFMQREELARLKEWWKLGYLTELSEAEVEQIEKVSNVLIVSSRERVYLPEEVDHGKKGDEVTILNTRCIDQNRKLIWDLTRCVTRPELSVGERLWNALGAGSESQRSLLFHELISVAVGKDTNYRIIHEAIRTKEGRMDAIRNALFLKFDQISSQLFSMLSLNIDLLESYIVNVKMGDDYKKCMKSSRETSQSCQKVLADYVGASGPLKSISSNKADDLKQLLKDSFFETDLLLKDLSVENRNRVVGAIRKLMSNIEGSNRGEQLRGVELVKMMSETCDGHKGDSEFVRCVMDGILPEIRIRVKTSNQRMANEIPSLFQAAKEELAKIR